MRILAQIAGVMLVCTFARPSAALTFNFTIYSGDTLSSSQAAALSTAADAWSAVLTDDIAVNLEIGFRSLGSNALGQSTPNFIDAPAPYIDGLLQADAKDAADAVAVASLSSQSARNLSVTAAEAKALGGNFPSMPYDGVIEFSSDYDFSTGRNANGTTPAGTYDLIGLAEHEIGHVLGFDSSIDGGTDQQTVLDQFRFKGDSSRSVTAGATAYFSINNGATSIVPFSTGGNGDYQASHWLQGAGGLMDPAVAAGVSQNITPLDIEALDVIGYDIAVPEPGSAAIMLIGLAGLAYARRRLT